MLRRFAALAAGLGLAVTAASPATAADSWKIPHTAEIKIHGHGFGHGRGMSQYGAQHAATLGVNYRDIVGFYYPGTHWGSAGGKVRVWISSDRGNDVQVAPRTGLTARRVGAAGSWNLTKAKPRATRWRIVASGRSASVLEYRAAGWHRFRKVVGQLEFAAGDRPIRLYLGNRTGTYRGALRSVPFEDRRLTVNVVPMESYLRGVVPSEAIGSSWNQQALRAQAVAARSYAAFERAERPTYYDLDDTERSQVYGGASKEYPSTDRAVSATAREILTYDGKPAATEFTASSGGWTVAGDHPYLPAQPDQWETADDPNESWTVRFTDDEIEAAWPMIGDLRRIAITGRDGHGEWGGRAGTVTLTGARRAKNVPGAEFAATLHLRSAWLSLRVQ